VDRSHHTVDFFTDHADDLRPVGLAFFQSEWDDSVRHVFHHVFSKSFHVFPAFYWLHLAWLKYTSHVNWHTSCGVTASVVRDNWNVNILYPVDTIKPNCVDTYLVSIFHVSMAWLYVTCGDKCRCVFHVRYG